MANVKYEVGSVYSTKKYGDFIITNYVNANNINIKFLTTGYETKTCSSCIVCGEIRDRYYPTVLDIGVIGDEATRDVRGEKFKEYILWTHMLSRCYSKRVHEKSPSYHDCTVSEKFKYYPFFKDWCNKQQGFNLVDADGNTFELDKDILIKGNKVYSEETCVFVPKEVNSVFPKCDRSRGIYPVGVNYHKASKKFVAQISYSKKKVHLGCFDTVEEAFLVYKKAKEHQIKSIAEKYKGVLDHRVYETMMGYVVELKD